MAFHHSDTSGTDDDLPPPSHPSHISRGGRINGNGKTATGAAHGWPTPEQQMRKLEQEAYTAVLRAFGAQSENITWAKERLMSDLRKELRVSDEQHREFLGKVAVDAGLRQIREGRLSGEEHIGLPMNAPPIPDAAPCPAVSASRKKQKTERVSQATLPPPLPLPALKPAPVPSSASAPGKRPMPVGSKGKKSKGGRQQPLVTSTMPKPPSGGVPPAGRLSKIIRGSAPATSRGGTSAGMQIDPWIGRRVKTRWPEDNAFYEAVITDYNPENGSHALTYGMNSDEETWEWVNLKELSSRDLKWVDAPPVVVSGKGSFTGVSGKGSSTGGSIAGQGGAGRGTRKAGGRGGLVSPAGRARIIAKNSTSSLEKEAPPVVPTRTWKGLAPSEIGLERKGSCQIQLPPLEALVKEVEKIHEEDDLVKLESAKRAAKEHEDMIRKALAEVGESSDEGESDDEQHPPSSHTQSMGHEKERRSRQDRRDQHGNYENNTAQHGRGEGSDGVLMIGGGANSDADDDNQAEDGDEDG